MDLKELSKPLPTEAITQHPTKTYLSSIKAIYVTERFNEVFGIGKWTSKVEFVKEDDKGMVIVKVIFEVPELGIYYESFGGNDNGGKSNKNFDLGDAYKGATTDALTKIGSYLGVGIEVFKGKSKNHNKKDEGKMKITEWIALFQDETDINHLATLWSDFNKEKWTEKQIKWATEEKDKAKAKLLNN